MDQILVFPKILAALDLSIMDEKIIRYSRFLVEQTDCTSLHFIHVVPQFIFPDTIGISFEEMMREEGPILHRIERKLAEEVQPVVDDLKGVDVRLEVVHGKPQQRLLEYAKETQPDLLVLGKKTLSGNSGIIARRTARKTKCAVCFVTEEAKTDIQRILVPVDFEKNSARALHAAVKLQTQLGEGQITAMHVIDLPDTAYHLNKNVTGLSDHLMKDAQKNFALFLNQEGIEGGGLHVKLPFNQQFDVAKHIQEVSHEDNSDLIIIGAVGQTVLEDLIFGSVTEKLVTLESEVPILVVR